MIFADKRRGLVPLETWAVSERRAKNVLSGLHTAQKLSHFAFLAGFTLIEMLVVLAVVAMIGSFIFIQLQQARARARDAEREGEIKTIQNALALYVVNNKLYPLYTGPLIGTDAVSTALIADNTLSQIPKYPQNTGNYQYTYTSTDGVMYTLTYYFETDSISGKSAGMQTASP